MEDEREQAFPRRVFESIEAAITAEYLLTEIVVKHEAIVGTP